MSTQVERIAAMEVRLKTLEEKVDSIDKKLDDLLAFKNKGQGAFLLVSMLFGSSVIGTVLYIVSWFKGTH